MRKDYDVIVVGGGHAGIEAGVAAAKTGMIVAVFAMSLDQIANMPCNPSIGGTAKGHIVFEITALGGVMGKAADSCMIQSRMLNRGKGPAVHSLRMQVDRSIYHQYMKKTLEDNKNIDVIQDEVIGLRVNKEKEIKGVVGKIWGEVGAKAVILACGTYLNGKIYVGGANYQSGPDGSLASTQLSETLKELGVKVRRFKTGTPARINKNSINFSVLKEQFGDDNISLFSIRDSHEYKNKISCHIAYTNENVHKIIRNNIDQSPLYSGLIEGTGPRYCPSIEDKIVRFKDKERHQIFIEPVGLSTNEMYLQGLSSSLPLNVQEQFITAIIGLENAQIMRPAYAIEYDCLDSLSLYRSLEFKEISGLFGAGQINGTSGYEEAAALGLVAGINAALKILKKPSLILERNSSYIGTLIDDIVTKGTPEPYRMMTARSENRLELRQDNAKSRLMETGYKLGLVDDYDYDMYLEEKDKLETTYQKTKKIIIKPNKEANSLCVSRETTPLKSGTSLYNLLKRPELSYSNLKGILAEEFDDKLMEKVEIKIKYEGYIKKQEKHIIDDEKLKRYKLGRDVVYKEIEGLRNEAVEKLEIIKPEDLLQAKRISGVNPADITLLQIWLKKRGNI